MANQSNQQRSRSQQSAERSVSGYVATEQEAETQHALDAERAKNARWRVLGSTLFGLVVGLIVFALTFWINLLAGIALGVVTGALVAVFVGYFAPTTVHSNIGAAPVEAGVLPRVEVLLNGLSATMGVATPSVAVLDDPIANAAIFFYKKQNTIVITSGLLSTMTVVELEGVFAHLLAHLRLESVKRGTAAAGIALLLGGLGRRGSISHRMMGEGRLFRADEVAARTVRYPVGLASALAKMEQGPLPDSTSIFASPVYSSIRWLFVDPSIARRAREDEVGDLDATGTRRQALEEQ